MLSLIFHAIIDNLYAVLSFTCYHTAEQSMPQLSFTDEERKEIVEVVN